VSFVLSPPILLLRRWGFGRVPSVLTVVFTALVIAFSVSAVLTRQVSELAIDLPLYQATINAKLDDLRAATADNAFFEKVSAALKKLGEINPHRPAPSSAPRPSDRPKNRLTEGQERERSSLGLRVVGDFFCQQLRLRCTRQFVFLSECPIWSPGHFLRL
jgi:hypothetical protein